MAVYRVTLRAVGLRAVFDGTEIPCGFFKNEFVWASSSEQAIEKAKANVARALRSDTQVNQEDLPGLNIEVDEVEAGVGIHNLLQRQGFVFHRLDEQH